MSRWPERYDKSTRGTLRLHVMQNAGDNTHWWNDEVILPAKRLKEEIKAGSTGIPKSWKEFRELVIIKIGKTVKIMRTSKPVKKWRNLLASCQSSISIKRLIQSPCWFRERGIHWTSKWIPDWIQIQKILRATLWRSNFKLPTSTTLEAAWLSVNHLKCDPSTNVAKDCNENSITDNNNNTNNNNNNDNNNNNNNNDNDNNNNIFFT